MSNPTTGRVGLDRTEATFTVRELRTAATHLNDMWVQQVAVVDEFTLHVLGDLLTTRHELNGYLLPGGAIHCKLDLPVGAAVDVLYEFVLGLSA